MLAALASGAVIAAGRVPSPDAAAPVSALELFLTGVFRTGDSLATDVEAEAFSAAGAALRAADCLRFGRQD